jgi:hypothetical protein
MVTDTPALPITLLSFPALLLLPHYCVSALSRATWRAYLPTDPHAAIHLPVSICLSAIRDPAGHPHPHPSK